MPRGAKLDQDDGSLLDCDVPIVLQLVDQAPDGQTDEIGVPLEEGQVLVDLDLREVVAQATEGAKYVQAAGL